MLYNKYRLEMVIMTIKDFVSALSGGYFDEKLHELYGNSDNEMLRNRIRYIDTCERFSRRFPQFDNICVYSVPAKITVCGVTLFLSADKIMISSENRNCHAVSDEIPKHLEKADMNETSEVPDCFSGYSLCISDLGSQRKKDEIPQISDDFFSETGELRKIHDERTIYKMSVMADENKRIQLAHDALMNADLPEFFSLVNGSAMYTLGNARSKTAVLLSRDFLSGDGAVTAENSVVKAFVPSYLADDYADRINSAFGDGKCDVMQIRQGGFEFTL